MRVSYMIGITLLVWVVLDLFTGKVYLHRLYQRQSEPLAYWLINFLWVAVALSFFINWS